MLDISSIISLLTKTDPIKACSASRLEGNFFSSKLLMLSLIFNSGHNHHHNHKHRIFRHICHNHCNHHHNHYNYHHRYHPHHMFSQLVWLSYYTHNHNNENKVEKTDEQILQDLQRLYKLYEQGAITQQEYEDMKAIMLEELENN